MKDFWNYQVGALLYCPANNRSLAKNIINGRFGEKYSLCLCLEDTICDKKVREAELDMQASLRKIYEAQDNFEHFYLPKIFIRVRCAEQIVRLIKELGEVAEIVTGFNLPKFNLENADAYLQAMESCSYMKPNIRFMPILESEDLANVAIRPMFLNEIKEKLKPFEERVVNIRVGGNDLSHIYGLRRHSYETIYDILPVAAALSDILQVFGKDYVVSGPVFEYYNGENWAEGLSRECAKDVVTGFVGKTAIHPKQIAIINESLKVYKEDYEDAKAILNWDENDSTYVRGNVSGSRMNEVKTHTNWARRICMLAEYYGIK